MSAATKVGYSVSGLSDKVVGHGKHSCQNRFVLWGSYLQVMVRDGLVVKLPCGRLSLPDETDRGIA